MTQILGMRVTVGVIFFALEREVRGLRQRINEMIAAQQKGFERIVVLAAEVKRLSKANL